MSRTALFALFTACMVAWTAPAGAQVCACGSTCALSREGEAAFDVRADAQVELTRSLFASRATPYVPDPRGAVVRGLSPRDLRMSPGFTRLIGALEVSGDDSSAGIAFDPLARATAPGWARHALPLAVTGTDDAGFSASAGYTADLVRDGNGRTTHDVTLEQLQRLEGLEACAFDERATRAKLEARRAAFVRMCALARGLPPSIADPLCAQGTECGQKRSAAANVCDPSWLDEGRVVVLDAALGALRDFKRRLSAALVGYLASLDSTLPPGSLAEEVAAITCHLDAIPDEELEMLDMPSPVSCYLGDGHDDLSAALRRYLWSRVHHRVGVTASSTFFALVGGFEAEGSPLSSAEMNLRYGFTRRNVTFSLGAGAKVGREERDDELVPLVLASSSISVVVRSPEDFCRDRACRLLQRGQQYPSIALGLDVTSEVAIDPPQTQNTSLQELRATLHVSFRVTKALAFRVGIPFQASVHVRDADPDMGVAERRALQYSIPVFATTVLELD